MVKIVVRLKVEENVAMNEDYILLNCIASEAMKK